MIVVIGCGDSYVIVFYPGVLFGCGTLVMLTSQLATSRLAQVHTMWKPVFLSLLLLSAGVAMVRVILLFLICEYLSVVK